MEYYPEKEEMLSLCDLKIYSDDPMPSEDQESMLSLFSSSSSSSLNQDFFGSFREERSSTSSSVSTNPPADDLISSGKTIHTLKQHVSGNHNERELEKNNKKKKSLFRWNSDSFCKSFNSKRASSQPTPLRSQSLPVLERKNEDKGKNGIMVERASKLVCPSKSRWQVFVLGSRSGRFPVKMELSDIRKRQLKRSPSTMFGWQDGGDQEEEGASVRSGKRLSGLIRVLGCGGGFNTEEIIKAAASCDL